jgi:hypothetical protein
MAAKKEADITLIERGAVSSFMLTVLAADLATAARLEEIVRNDDDLDIHRHRAG